MNKKCNFSALAKLRLEAAPSIEQFNFNKRRTLKLTPVNDVPLSSKCVLYWMCRDFRVQDNWSLLLAQRIALKYNLSVEVIVFAKKFSLYPTSRQYKFFLEGLIDVENECKELNIGFHLINDDPVKSIPKLMKDNFGGTLVYDFFPLKQNNIWIDNIKNEINVPVIMVDSHNIVPALVASDKQEYSAATIRRKINSILDDYLTPFPPVQKQKKMSKFKAENVAILDDLISGMADDNMPKISWAKGGYIAGLETLNSFCEKNLKDYENNRNDPNKSCVSNLSPWLHFGHISAQRCVLIVNEFLPKYKGSVKAFVEEIVIRRELADNFCFYNKHYDSLEGAHSWAQETLTKHTSDKRDYIYDKVEFEKAKTHDDLWNSAQLELVQNGKMHGFMRMYWAKKILEWTRSPQDALEIALYLNDRYSLDGTDPNGYVGVMWSICGVHDMGWKERQIFGKIRFMNFEGCKRKFKILEYIEKWGGVVCSQPPKKKIKKNNG